MPIYLYSYIQTSNKFPLPTDQTPILPFTAAWAVLSNLPLLVPGIMGASPFVIQLSTVVWFFLPLAAAFVQNRISVPSTKYRPGKPSNPAIVGYGIVGSASAMIHVAVGLGPTTRRR